MRAGRWNVRRRFEEDGVDDPPGGLHCIANDFGTFLAMLHTDQ